VVQEALGNAAACQSRQYPRLSECSVSGAQMSGEIEALEAVVTVRIAADDIDRPQGKGRTSTIMTRAMR